jgi:predicted transcriptional regulator
LELDELKKGKYELELKTEDNEFVYRQLDELRQFCSKLEEEKKDAVFREEAMKLQLETLIESEDRNNITQKL